MISTSAYHRPSKTSREKDQSKNSTYYSNIGPELLVCCLAHRDSTGVFLLLLVSVSYSAPKGISIVGQLTESVSPRFLFIMVIIMIYLFVIDDSLTSKRFTMGIEQLTKCCEPLQKMRVRLGACKIDLNPLPCNFILPIVPRRYFCCGCICFMFWSRIFVLFEPYLRFHIFI